MAGTNKHPQSNWRIEQSIKDDLRRIADHQGVKSVCGMARMILIQYIKTYKATHPEAFKGKTSPD